MSRCIRRLLKSSIANDNIPHTTHRSIHDLQVCAILKEKYDGDIPRTFEELMELPGIGPKMVRFSLVLLLFPGCRMLFTDWAVYDSDT